MIDVSLWQLVQFSFNALVFILVAVVGWIVAALHRLRERDDHMIDLIGTDAKKIAVLEAQHEHALEHISLIREDLAKLEKTLQAILQELRSHETRK